MNLKTHASLDSELGEAARGTANDITLTLYAGRS